VKIAIVAPSPIPFTVGGAEKLWWGILEYINKHTTYHCELIKIPTKEDNFWNLIDSYYKFYSLDLSHFDMIISTKYPVWMVQHHNHHLYMFHCLRGLYDTYHFTGLSEKVETDNKKILKLLKLIDNNEELSLVFNELFKLKNDNSIPQELFIFPGPLIRKIVHYFDKKAMGKIKNFSAISQTVIDRKDYFPNNVKVKKIYPPTHLNSLKNESYNYFFTASRMDGPKRVKDIILAYKKVKTNIPLKIAGTGPLMEELKELARDDKRIEFLGFVSDEKLIEYYANACAVIFIPYDEDYGLITIEAMMSEKPVITYLDSGGVTEFVEHGVTGLISKPNIDSLAQNIEYIANDLKLCIKMGKEANRRVSNITWENLIKNLLEKDNSFNINKNNKDKITVVTTYPVYPPRGGGQNRIFYLYKELANFYKIFLLCLVNENECYKVVEIAPDLYEVRIPKSKKFIKKEWEMQQKAGIPITDLAVMFLYQEIPLYIEKFIKYAKKSDIVIASHPYFYPMIKQYITDKLIVYESHNVEYDLKKQMLKENEFNNKILKKLYDIEKMAIRDSKLITVCSFLDKQRYFELFNIKKINITEVSNGVDLSKIKFYDKIKRISRKKEIGISKSKIAIFIGSWHQPNIEATEVIFSVAKKLPHYNFIILGSVGEYFKNKNIEIPKNVGFAGIVDDEEKEMYLSIADVAINPMISGSGTNLKMLDYMASGIPVVSTEIGCRGLRIPDDCVIKSDIDNFDKAILNAQNKVNIQKARKLIEKNYAWNIICKKYKKALDKII